MISLILIFLAAEGILLPTESRILAINGGHIQARNIYALKEGDALITLGQTESKALALFQSRALKVLPILFYERRAKTSKWIQLDLQFEERLWTVTLDPKAQVFDLNFASYVRLEDLLIDEKKSAQVLVQKGLDFYSAAVIRKTDLSLANQRAYDFFSEPLGLWLSMDSEGDDGQKSCRSSETPFVFVR